ncbi:MAG: hypothetical protein F6K03_02325 [Kamptonema sp. SIO4C4]|nr:hypothetical protein [Kamptonema sp. SIO4C4]
MSYAEKPAIAFLSLAPNSSLSPLRQALTQLGWQIYLFTAVPETQSECSHCHVIPLDCEQTPAMVGTAIANFQIKNGGFSSLLHTFDAAAAQVGRYLQQQQGWRWLHSDRVSVASLQPERETVSPADQWVILYETSAATAISQTAARRQLGLSKQDRIFLYDASVQSLHGISHLLTTLTQYHRQNPAYPWRCLLVQPNVDS